MNTEIPKRNVFFKRLLLTLVLVIVLLISLFLILAPHFAKNYINKNGKELTGRKINIEKIKINYFTSTLQIIDFSFFEQDDSALFVNFDTLMVNIKPLKLLNDEIYVEQFQLINPKVQVVQN
ncbi:MAG: hypothetical protein EP310_03200, partial [Bacteroidetes bacterium]